MQSIAASVDVAVISGELARSQVSSVIFGCAPRRGDAPFVVSSSDCDDLFRPRYLSRVVLRLMQSIAASVDVAVISGELAQDICGVLALWPRFFGGASPRACRTVFIPILYHHGGATRTVDRPVERVQLSGRLFSFSRKTAPPGRPGTRERLPAPLARATPPFFF